MNRAGDGGTTLRRLSGLLVAGGLADGWRVPPERELAAAVGASRVTVRQALAALERAGLLAARQGSGVVVRPCRDWTLAGLAALLRADGGPPADVLRPLAVEALALRRSVARRLPAELAGRIAPGALVDPRRLAEAAGAARGKPARLVALDAAALRAVYEAAGAWSAAWLWNDLVRVALALAERLPGPAPVAADYAARSAELFDALERGDASKAERLLGAHLSRLDRGLLDAFPRGAAPADASERGSPRAHAPGGIPR